MNFVNLQSIFFLRLCEVTKKRQITCLCHSLLFFLLLFNIFCFPFDVKNCQNKPRCRRNYKLIFLWLFIFFFIIFLCFLIELRTKKIRRKNFCVFTFLLFSFDWGFEFATKGRQMVRERDIEMFFKFCVGEREIDSVRTG